MNETVHMQTKKNLLTFLDWTPEDILETLEFAKKLKSLQKQGECPKTLLNKIYAMFFHKNSLRTRVSFEAGITQLGGTCIHLTQADFEIGKRESVADVARVISRYVDGILIRTFAHEDVEELAKYASVPVVNMLTDWSHPCQIFADAFTIIERLGSLENKKITYLGDGNNIVHSWLALAARIPIEFTIATSPDTMPDPQILKIASQNKSSKIQILHDAKEAVSQAEVIYTDVWASMGEKEMLEERLQKLQPFQVNQDLLKCASPDAIVMHCLPAEKGREITHDVLEGKQSVVWDQAENRLHVQKAILTKLELWRH